MASLSHSSVTFSGAASDLLQSSGNEIRGVPLKSLGKAMLGTKKQEFSVVAKIRKVKKHDYPWPDNPDENIEGGVLRHLSHFKPLKEKPKPVTLEFEKPLLDLEKNIMEVRKVADETGLNFSDQILSLETKYKQALKDLYTHLTPIQRVSIARHPNRPTCLDHVFNITETFFEQHGDRAGYDDPAIVCGLGRMDGRTYTFIGHQKGRNTKENIQRNFGMPTPHGYRKALRAMKYADHFGFPIVTLVDTPGAYADLKSEELGQGVAIAENLRAMFGLKVPIISVVIGEGGSGGALAIACANKMLMLENSVFYVASPEACAAILWKTPKAIPMAAEKLKITAEELVKQNIADSIIPEPLGGAHADPSWTSQQIKKAILEAMDELEKMDTDELLKHRTHKYRKLGGFQEGISMDPNLKFNMKKRDIPIQRSGGTEIAQLETDIKRLKQQILEAKPSAELRIRQTLQKLRREFDHELSVSINALGLKDKVSALKGELSNATTSRPPDPSLDLKIQSLQEEIQGTISSAPNFTTLNAKADLLKEAMKSKILYEKDKVKSRMRLRLNELMDRPDLKTKIQTVRTAMRDCNVSRLEDLSLNASVKEGVEPLLKEIESEFSSVMKRLGLESVGRVKSKAKLEGLNEVAKELKERIEEVMESPDVREEMETVRSEISKGGKVEDLKVKMREVVERGLRLRAPDLLERYEKLVAEIEGGFDERLIKQSSEEESNAEYM